MEGHVALRLFPDLSELGGMRHEGTPCGRESGAPLVSDQQLLTEKSLERLQTSADRGLSDPQTTSRLNQAAGSRDFQECLRKNELHVR